ncbi:MAG: tyrosine-type recombinase/integrase [Pyrinomonadaceae bacterium]
MTRNTPRFADSLLSGLVYNCNRRADLTARYRQSVSCFSESIIWRRDFPNSPYRRHYKPILKKAELSENIRLYDLRHTCATLLLSADKSPKVIAERLGHSTIVLTLDTYSHVLPSMQKDATDELEQMLFQRKKSK